MQMRKYYPISIEYLRNAIKFNNYPVVSNICYTFQYITYLDKHIKEDKLTTVIKSLLIKDYIINSIAIIEAIFYLIIIYNNVNITNYKFNNMLKIISKNNLLPIDLQNLNSLRKLRNKVHIYSIKEAKNTDYNLFTIKEYILMKKILKNIFLNNLVINKEKSTFIQEYFEN